MKPSLRKKQATPRLGGVDGAGGLVGAFIGSVASLFSRTGAAGAGVVGPGAATLEHTKFMETARKKEQSRLQNWYERLPGDGKPFDVHGPEPSLHVGNPHYAPADTIIAGNAYDPEMESLFHLKAWFGVLHDPMRSDRGQNVAADYHAFDPAAFKGALDLDALTADQKTSIAMHLSVLKGPVDRVGASASANADASLSRSRSRSGPMPAGPDAAKLVSKSADYRRLQEEAVARLVAGQTSVTKTVFGQSAVRGTRHEVVVPAFLAVNIPALEDPLTALALTYAQEVLDPNPLSKIRDILGLVIPSRHKAGLHTLMQRSALLEGPAGYRHPVRMHYQLPPAIANEMLKARALNREFFQGLHPLQPLAAYRRDGWARFLTEPSEMTLAKEYARQPAHFLQNPDVTKKILDALASTERADSFTGRIKAIVGASAGELDADSFVASVFSFCTGFVPMYLVNKVFGAWNVLAVGAIAANTGFGLGSLQAIALLMHATAWFYWRAGSCVKALVLGVNHGRREQEFFKATVAENFDVRAKAAQTTAQEHGVLELLSAVRDATLEVMEVLSSKLFRVCASKDAAREVLEDALIKSRPKLLGGSPTARSASTSGLIHNSYEWLRTHTRLLAAVYLHTKKYVLKTDMHSVFLEKLVRSVPTGLAKSELAEDLETLSEKDLVAEIDLLKAMLGSYEDDAKASNVNALHFEDEISEGRDLEVRVRKEMAAWKARVAQRETAVSKTRSADALKAESVRAHGLGPRKRKSADARIDTSFRLREGYTVGPDVLLDSDSE